MPTLSAAQTVYGRVLDATTGGGISGAIVSLIDARDSVVARFMSDSAGVFRLGAMAAGTYRVRGERIGYAASTSQPLEITMRESFTVELKMSVAGIPIDPLVVTVSGLERGRDGFARRSLLGKGHFLNLDSIRRRGPTRTSELFQGIKGISVTDTIIFGGDMPGGYIVPKIRTLLGWGSFAVFHNNQVEPILFSSGRANTQLRTGVMRDVRVRSASFWPAFMNEFIPPKAIQGIEIYRSFAEVPNELKRTQRGSAMWPEDQLGPCGIAIIWSRAAW